MAPRRKRRLSPLATVGIDTRESDLDQSSYVRHGRGLPAASPHRPEERMPDAEAIMLARQRAKVQSDPDRWYAPTRSINPEDPRTRAASYYSVTQMLVVEWGDGGVPYAYYDVTPQEWDGFIRAVSPGRFINDVLNAHEYGPTDQRVWQSGRNAGQRRRNYNISGAGEQVT